jgi:hypothetical protein
VLAENRERFQKKGEIIANKNRDYRQQAELTTTSRDCINRQILQTVNRRARRQKIEIKGNNRQRLQTA